MGISSMSMCYLTSLGRDDLCVSVYHFLQAGGDVCVCVCVSLALKGHTHGRIGYNRISKNTPPVQGVCVCERSECVCVCVREE